MRSCNMITWQLVLHKLSRLTTLYLMPNDWRTVQVRLSLYLSLLASCGMSFLHYCNLCDGKLLPIDVLMLFEHELLILASVLAARVDREALILQGLGFIYSVFFFFFGLPMHWFHAFCSCFQLCLYCSKVELLSCIAHRDDAARDASMATTTSFGGWTCSAASWGTQNSLLSYHTRKTQEVWKYKQYAQLHLWMILIWFSQVSTKRIN